VPVRPQAEESCLGQSSLPTRWKHGTERPANRSIPAIVFQPGVPRVLLARALQHRVVSSNQSDASVIRFVAPFYRKTVATFRNGARGFAFMLVSAIGYLAAICSMVSFAPQAWKIIKFRDTSSISLWAYVVTVAGFALWLTFGFLKGEWPLVVSNAVCLLLSGFILTMKALPAKAKEAVAETLDVA
jgi:MtN3 and saliva related transmembrane protein